MLTALEYLSDTYAYRHRTNVRQAGTDERGPYLVFRSTVFHPQGGGQPSDTGICQVGDAVLTVTSARAVAGEVHHYVDLHIAPSTGAEVELQIDSHMRIAHAKLHTAGHLVANMVERTVEGLRAVKGYHYPEGAYVEFEGDVDAERIDGSIGDINLQLSSALNEKLTVKAAMADIAMLSSALQRVPDYLPADGPIRVVEIGDLGPIPCGGTHLRSLGELASVRIDHARRKKGQWRLGYSCN